MSSLMIVKDVCEKKTNVFSIRYIFYTENRGIQINETITFLRTL